jgi:hypothetical protein
MSYPGRTITKLTREFVSKNVGQDTINDFNRMSCSDQYFYIFKYLATFKRTEFIFFCETCYKRELCTESDGEYYVCGVAGCIYLKCEDCFVKNDDVCGIHNSLFEILRQHTLL